MKETILQKVSEQGFSFLLMGIIVYALWTRQVAYEKKMEEDMISFKAETKECQTTYKELLTEQVTNSTRVIEENTRILKTLENKLQ